MVDPNMHRERWGQEYLCKILKKKLGVHVTDYLVLSWCEMKFSFLTSPEYLCLNVSFLINKGTNEQINTFIQHS